MPVLTFGRSVIAGMPWWRIRSPFSRALNRAFVTRFVSAVWSERSSTVTAFFPASAAISSPSGKGCSSLIETTPTFFPCLRR